MNRTINAPTAPSGVTVRIAERADSPALVRLAALDSAQVPVGPTLLAEVGGEAVAALPVRGGGGIADPFRRTAAITEMLALRAAQLRGDARPKTETRSSWGWLASLVRAVRPL